MALKNVTKEDLTIKYNGKEITLKPQASADVRDFGVGSDDVESVERFLAQKNPSVEVVKTKTAEDTVKELLIKIGNLERENSGLKAKIDDLTSEDAPKKAKK